MKTEIGQYEDRNRTKSTNVLFLVLFIAYVVYSVCPLPAEYCFGVLPNILWKLFEKYEGFEYPTMYITSATENFFCCNSIAAFFILMDFIYSTGEKPVSCFIVRRGRLR